MDVEEIKSSVNTLKVSEKFFDDISPNDDDKKTDVELPQDISNISSNLLYDKISTCETNLDMLDIHLIDDNERVDNEHLENFCRVSKNEEDSTEVILPEFQLSSKNINVEQNTKIDSVLTQEIVSTQEPITSDSVAGPLIMKDLEISPNKREEFNFDNRNENSLIQSSIHATLPKNNFDISSESTDTFEDGTDKINGTIFREEISADDNINRVQANMVDGLIPEVHDNDNEQINSKHFNVASNNDGKRTISNCNGQITQGLSLQQTIPENLSNDYCIPTALDDKSVNVEVSNLNSTDYLTRRNSATELSTIYKSKPTLADDAKLVKFSVSTKSMNIIQSNAQFLNKSKNFLNFITEKSTNIMEKTLLPQNLAAKYNSILRMTDNSPMSYQKFTEESGKSSDSLKIIPSSNSDSNLAHDCETSNQIMKDVTKGMQHIDTTDSINKEQETKLVLDGGIFQEDVTAEDQKLFQKCSVNKNKLTEAFTTIKQETEFINVSSDTYLENNQSNNFETPNIMNQETLSNSNFYSVVKEQSTGSLKNSNDRNLSNEIFLVMQRENSESSKDINTSSIKSSDNTEVNEQNSTKKEVTVGVMPISNDENNVQVLSNSTTPSINNMTHSDELQKNDEPNYTNVGLKDQCFDLELLDPTAYTTLLRDYRNLKEKSAKLSEEMLKLKLENQRLTAENSDELHTLQLETLEKTIEKLKHDLKQSTANQEMLSKEYQFANKEKESMVMKYAISEKQLIDMQRAREYAERKVNEAFKEQELLHTKLKQVQGERTRICNILDAKCHELTNAQKEVERLKEELSMREIKLKWTQNKLKTELDTQKENQQKLNKAMLRINEMKEECEQIRKESYEAIRKFQQSEENKVVTLDEQLKEQQARLILERHVTEDKELSRLQLQKEVETLKQRQLVLIEENNTLSLKVQNLEKERLNYENNLSNLKVIADQRQKEIVDLVGKVSQLETMKLQLQHKEQLLSSNETEVERLRQSNSELQADMEWCREREAHMLDFTQKLTDKNVCLQSEFTAIEAKNEQLELEQGLLHDKIEELSSKVKTLEISLASEKSKRTEECELLARHVAEQTQLARNLAQKLEDSQGENAVLRRKQQVSIKEMTKELQMCKKKLDAFETGSPSNSLDRTSRTGSSSSLSTGETLNGAMSDNSNSGDHIIQSVEPDRQTLIDRIVKLQRIRVKQAEKLDFLEEHARTLVNELQKKTKIIKNYILHENSDAMGSNERDRNKAELAKHGGIMASVYNQRVSDDNMTLELSLEINQKLQAVLEDTLLKNITLKDSIDTLGGEIARLTMHNNRKQ